MCWVCVSVSCFGILHGFYFPTWHTLAPPCASWVSALTLSNLPILSQELCTKTGGRGTAERLCGEWLGNDTKSYGPKVKYVTSLLNVDRALTHLEGMVDTYFLRFWNSGNPAKYFTSLKSSLFILTSQDNIIQFQWGGKKHKKMMSRFTVWVWGIFRGSELEPPALQNPIPSFHPGRLGLDCLYWHIRVGQDFCSQRLHLQPVV